MFLEIEHRLSFAYDAFIRESFLELRMQPKTTEHQALSSFVLAVGPPTKISRYRDWNDNTVHHFTIVNYHDRIEVSADRLTIGALAVMEDVANDERIRREFTALAEAAAPQALEATEPPTDEG